MTQQWIDPGRALPIIEVHDIRTEKSEAARYLEITQRLAPGFALLGGAELGHFSVEGQPDRLVVLRAFGSAEARRGALRAFHAGAGWAAQRRELAEATRSAEVILCRTVTPGEGLQGLPAGGRLRLLVSELRFAEQIGSYHLWLRLLLRKAGIRQWAALATLETSNDVPAVPVLRHRTHHVALLGGEGAVPALPPDLRAMTRFSPEVLRLTAPHADVVTNGTGLTIIGVPESAAGISRERRGEPRRLSQAN